MSDKTPTGPSAADRKPGEEKGRFDKPSRGEDDFATDEMPGKPIRGFESHESKPDGASKGDD